MSCEIVNGREYDPDNLSGDDICRLLDMSKWKHHTPELADACHQYITKLCKKHGCQWLHDNRFKVVNDFEDYKREIIKQAAKDSAKQREKAKKRKSLLSSLFKR